MTSTRTTSRQQQAAAPAPCNEVRLVGRLAAEPEARELPSGDLVVTFRLVVARPPSVRRAVRSPTVDTVDCTAWRRGVQRTVAAYAPGDVVEVNGSLRRRFWRGPSGPASRTEVEVTAARRRARADPPT